MKERESFNIDGIDFQTQEYDFDYGFTLFAKLFKMFGKTAFSFLIQGLDGILKDLISGNISQNELLSLSKFELLAKIDRSKISEYFDYFFDKFDPLSLVPLAHDILISTWIIDTTKSPAPRREINYKTDFKGKYGTALKVLKTVLGLQFASSFQGLLATSSEQIKSEKVKEPQTQVHKIVAR